ncbi:MAG TPA: DUF2795 domain-containing protein [Pedococcus sp.]|jgi:hypothetical protein|uniref:DUF2795 domain-containing protein n=1 Tax=Pedococcus sp. TaxID=2860345 RepID=UPI002F92F74A
MTASAPSGPATHTPSRTTADWRAELATLLRPHVFPANQDELLAALIRRGAPSELLWRLTCLPRTRRFTSVEEVCGFVAAHGPAPVVAEPM